MIKKFCISCMHAFSGILSAIRSEVHMKIHLVCTVLVILFGSFLKISPTQWLVCIGWISLVIGGELLNTAIESVVDMVMPEYHDLAKKAKDTAAGAVLVFAIGAAISAAIIFLPKLAALFS